MLDDAADIVQRGFRQVGIARAGEQRLAGLPDRLVHMHARAVVAENRLRHEGRGLAIGMGHIVDHILVDLHVVGRADQRVELDAEFGLGGGHLMMVLLDRHVHLVHDGQHLGAHVDLAVHRRNREIAALHRDAVAVIAFREFLAGDIGAFLGIQLVHHRIHLHFVANVVEHEEFGFRAEIGGVAEAGGGEMLLGALGDRAGIAVIELASRGLDHVTEDDQLGLGGERVENGGRQVRLQDHVGLVDALPAGDRRTVEHDAFAQQVLVDGHDMLGGVLPLAARIGEAEIDVFDVVFLDEFEDLLDVGHGGFPRWLRILVGWRPAAVF